MVKTPILRLAYITLFLIALFTVFTLWSQVGGQAHLDLLPWHIKLVLALAASYSIVRATAAAVADARGWNPQSVKWLGILLATLVLCGAASSYAHTNLEDAGDDESGDGDDTSVSSYKLSAVSYQQGPRLGAFKVAETAVRADLPLFAFIRVHSRPELPKAQGHAAPALFLKPVSGELSAFLPAGRESSGLRPRL